MIRQCTDSYVVFVKSLSLEGLGSLIFGPKTLNPEFLSYAFFNCLTPTAIVWVCALALSFLVFARWSRRLLFLRIAMILTIPVAIPGFAWLFTTYAP